MVFSTKTIQDSTKRKLPLKETITESIDENISFLLSVLESISEQEKIFNKCLNDTEVLNEKTLSFSFLLKETLKRIDFKKLIGKILQSFMDLLEKIWKQFHALLLNLFGEDKVINYYKDKILSSDINIKFNKERFIYTNLGSSTSYTTYQYELEKEYSSLIQFLEKISLSDNNSYFDLFEEMKNSIDLSDTYFDELRGKVVGSRSGITNTEFPTALHDFFRNNGKTIPEGKMIFNSEIKEILAYHQDYHKLIKEISSDKKELKESSKSLQKRVENTKLEDYVKEGITQEATTMFIDLLKNKSRRIKMTCDIFLQVFAAKLDAAKESYIQSRAILFQVSKEIVKQ